MPENTQKLLRISKLMKVARKYLPSGKYNHLALKIQTWEPENLWENLTIEIESLIPKNPKDEKCVKIYSYLWDENFNETKEKLFKQIKS